MKRDIREIQNFFSSLKQKIKDYMKDKFIYLIIVIIIANMTLYVSIIETIFTLEITPIQPIKDLPIIKYLSSGGLYQNVVVLMATYIYDFNRFIKNGYNDVKNAYNIDKDKMMIKSYIAILLLIASSILGYNSNASRIYIILEFVIWVYALKINYSVFVLNNNDDFSHKYEPSTKKEKRLEEIRISNIESDGDIKI